ncbi:MAG: hypothetical protein HC778_09120 [Chamaesiphon sp. CSU_1_12]|nr:hypothetical protein [Chamaesiphon sp. CSU_1_12]
MQNITKIVIKLALLPLTLSLGISAQASQVPSQWYFGKWDCSIDRRPAKMQWLVVDDPQTSCSGGVCSSSSGVKVVGRFSDNGSAWVPLSKNYVRGNDFGIRYQGAEPDNWFLRYNPSTKVASGWTTWRNNKYPLQCAWRSR